VRTRTQTKRRRPRTRDVAKLETRAALVDAGLAAFAAHGLDAPSLDDICARAGYTRGAFYVHFRDREDFVVAVMERVLGGFLDAMISTADQAHDLELTVTRFSEALDAASRRRAGRPSRALAGGVQVHRLLEACSRSTTLRGRVVGLVQQALGRITQAAAAGQSAHTIRPDVDPAQVATLVVMLGIGLLVADELGVPLDATAGRTLVLTLLGSGPPGAVR